MNKSSNASATAGGVSTFTVIGIVFIILKLTGVINWSWVWVLAPFWIPISLLILRLGIVSLFIIISNRN